MKAVQVVLDDALLKRLDRLARQRRMSRSAVIRDTLERALRMERMEQLIDKERRAYAERPLTKDEQESHQLLQSAARAALDRLDGDTW